jgi:hypothetical protein
VVTGKTKYTGRFIVKVIDCTPDYYVEKKWLSNILGPLRDLEETVVISDQHDFFSIGCDEKYISIITSTEPKIIPINYKIVKGYYTVDISYKNGLYVVDNQTITIGLTKGERQVHINFPQSAYKLI